jgi:glycosyltransferase involved in cell wall biosynthesis
VTFGGHDARRIEGQLEIRVIGNAFYVRGQKNNPLSLKLLSELRWAEVVHCHQQHILASSLAALFCRGTGRRAFVTDLGGGGWDVSAYVSTDGWYDGHLHISEYSRSAARHRQNVAAEVILGGVDTNRFCPDASVAREPLALYVGRILPHKGVNYLLDAMVSGVKLEIIGQPYDAAFYGDLKRAAIGKTVSFRHDCGDRELVQAYRRALCVVLPSVYKSANGREGRVPELLGQTLLEGMACGTPAICSDVASMPEVVKDGETGFIVPPNDPLAIREKIQWLYEHPLEAVQMGNRARAWVLEKYTWPGTVRRCLETYQGRRH